VQKIAFSWVEKESEELINWTFCLNVFRLRTIPPKLPSLEFKRLVTSLLRKTSITTMITHYLFHTYGHGLVPSLHWWTIYYLTSNHNPIYFAARHFGLRVRLQKKRSRFQIPPGCKVFRSLNIAVLLSKLEYALPLYLLEEKDLQKYFLIKSQE
jgi:hypothetical protein